ncbi:Myb_DNA-bind_6 domain-containing protein [Cephalotus follicularis]|uniref:Myb_DNA-bind_6 domain-containing protein n=1 Tax=Cephalotus follicularis TaxID=3775 RepID=A0A1Q3BIX9_CEPFO|nr:Myb_DNA-bind_6 domain-containing protein [Cephalotus follicularis]
MNQEQQMRKKFANGKCNKANIDESFDPVLDDESIEVQHLLAEPKNEHVTVDGVLCLNKEKSGKCLEMEEFSYGFEYGLKKNYGGLDINNTREGEDDLKLEILDGLLDGVDEVDDIYAANDLASACEDFLLDIELAENVSGLDCGLCDGSRLGNSSSESRSPGFSGSSNGAVGVSESSMATIPEPECKDDSHDKTVFCDSLDTFRSKRRRQVPVDDKKCPTACIQDSDELEDDDKPLVNFILSCKKGKSSVQTTKVGILSKHKRLRKPTQRFIEEFSDTKSRSIVEREDVSTDSKDKHLKLRSYDKLDHTKASALASMCDPFYETSAQTFSESRLRRGRGRPKKRASVSWHESDAESEDDHASKKKHSKSADRRKHQRMWTLSEVTKLVDGIAQYGVSRWTDIKRQLFSASSYRTPIDLRDKWRNLLRASCVHKQRKREVMQVEKRQKQATRPLPLPLLLRVRDLATANPYPKLCSSKRSRAGHLPSPALVATKEGAQFSAHGRNLRRKKCT